MSVLVNGMKMPDSCYHCKIAESCGHYITNYTNRRHPECPLVALPDKHGRLVDADALIRDHFSPEHRIALSETDKAWMRRIINDSPTIVEAEDEP